MIKKDLAQDERVLVQIDRPQFNELAENGTREELPQGL